MQKIIIGCLIVAAFFFIGCKQATEDAAEEATKTLLEVDKIEQKQESEEEMAIIQCQHLFQLKQAEGADLSQGPCLSNQVIPNWVCDVAHNPREARDNDPANQCSAFREGQAKHFVELDLKGEVIKAG